MPDRHPLRPLWLALSLMTTLPVPQVPLPSAQDFSRASGFYPLAGYLIGLGSSAALGVAGWLGLPRPVAAALALAAWLALSGLLHFDGLVDSADALLAARPPAARRAILKDLHLGAFALGVGAAALLLKWSLLDSVALWAPVQAAVLARLAVLWPMRYPALGDSSLSARSRPGWWWLAVLLALPVLWLPGGWLAALLVLACTSAASAWAASRLGGVLNGDIYGMVIELAELSALLAASRVR